MCCPIFQTSRWPLKSWETQCFWKSFPFRKTLVVTKFFVLSWHFHSFIHLTNSIMKCVLCAKHWSVYYRGEVWGRQAGQLPSRSGSNNSSQDPWQGPEATRQHTKAMPATSQGIFIWLLGGGSHPEALGSDLHGSRIPATTLTGGCLYRIPLPRNLQPSYSVLHWDDQVNTG